MALTELGIRKLKPPKAGRRREKYDREIRGFGIRITDRAVRSYILLYTHGGRRRRYTIGRVSEIPIDQAREIAPELRGQIRQGRDPAAEQKLARTLAKTAVTPKTFRETVDLFEKRVLAGKRRGSQPGKGSIFTIQLPRIVQTGDGALTEAHGRKHPKLVHSIAADAEEPLIVVVDDDVTVRELVQRHLERAGFVVVTAGGGQEGLRLVRGLRPAAVTLDIMMPDLDGWTVLAAMKGDPALASIPVVLMSIVDEKNRGYALGAADYLVKPVDRTKLVETLTNICGSTAGKALLVDDDEMVRRGVRQALEPIGWKVTEAENGQVAVESLTAARPDVIILDLMMPKMDGFEFLDELRSRSDWQDIPVVVITSKDLTDEDRDRLNGGVERVIQKSDRDEMLRQLSRALVKCVKRQTRGAHEDSIRRT